MSAEPEGRIRAFVALETPDDLRVRVQALVDELKRLDLGDIRWTGAAGWHVTLRFLGASTPKQIDAMRRDLGAAAANASAFDLDVSGPGMFPERGAPRVMWVGAPVPPGLAALQQSCERAARDARFEPESRAFKAHLTIARWRSRVPRPRLEPRDLGRAHLDRLVLFKSDLKPTGSVYTPIDRWTLR